MQRNLHITKTQFDTARDRQREIEEHSARYDSKLHLFGEPSMEQITLDGLQGEYIDLLNISCNYIMYNSHKKSVTGAKNKYFITFTHNNVTPKDAFKTAVKKQLERTIFTHVEYTFEHEETNIHAHATVESRFTLNSQNFISHSKKHGYVQVKLVKTDNGTSEYMNKENPSDTV